MQLETLQEYWLTLPGTTESVKWEDHLCFCIGEKMYAVTSLSGELSLSIKASDEQFAQLVDRPEFIPAPYMARYKWVYAADFSQIPDQELRQLIRSSYDLIRAKLPKRIRQALERMD